mgnify:CR=1 FL=1
MKLELNNPESRSAVSQRINAIIGVNVVFCPFNDEAFIWSAKGTLITEGSHEHCWKRALVILRERGEILGAHLLD